MTKADIVENVYEKVGGFSKKEAAEIAARTNGFEFELPAYKYNALFQPIDEILKK